MRIFLVVEETVFFHPEFVQDFIKKTKDEIVGAALVTKVKKKNNIERYMITHFYYLSVLEIVKLAFRQIRLQLLDRFNPKHAHTVCHVLKNEKVPFIKVEYDINSENYLNYIRKTKPDIIVSSQSLYFGKELLEIPTVCCINRHSSLLPRNGGLWPGFQAVRKGERETGVTVHTMGKRIDSGKILSQIIVPIHPNETVWDIYKDCFEKSTDALLEALEKIRNNDFSTIENGYKREYYSFPTKENWKEFRQRKGRYV